MSLFLTFISRRFSAMRALASSSDVMIFFPVELNTFRNVNLSELWTI